jgi:hypothetical protein
VEAGDGATEGDQRIELQDPGAAEVDLTDRAAADDLQRATAAVTRFGICGKARELDWRGL